ncbi:MAG: hypothetical protein KDD48_08630 [Bdellovibrionales bacterium]|nr:hypothetical protein [Bdellovibrionales bacterium]
MAIEKNNTNIGNDLPKDVIATSDKNFDSEEITSPMNEPLKSSEAFYSRNRRYSRYRSTRGGRNSLM